MALATMQKGTSTAEEYIGKMKSLADDMATAGKKLDDEELCSYILAGLDFEYNSFVSSIAARAEAITVSELYAQLLAFESRLDLQHTSQSPTSANAASRGGRGGNPRGRGGRNSGRGRGDFFNIKKPRSNNSGSNQRPTCQLCGRIGHTVIKC